MLNISDEIKTLQLTSTSFNNMEYIPSKYTCDGENINPPLTIQNIPQKTKSLVLIVDDPDAPIRTWAHWIVWNIAPCNKIKEKSILGTEGNNDFGKQHYCGPCPPSGSHRYFFKVYALNSMIELNPNASKIELEKIMNPYIIGFGELIGLYKRVL